MTEDNTEKTTEADEQGQATEPTPNDGVDEQSTSEEATNDSLPTHEEVDAAVKAIEEEEDSAGADDEEDDDDVESESDRSDGLLKKLRKKNREAKGLRDRATAAELKSLQYEAADKTGLPLSMAARLQGSTAEELQKDAESLKELIGKKNLVPGARPDTGERQGGFKVRPEDETDLDTIASRIYQS